MSLASRLEQLAAERPGDAAIICEGRRVSFNQLDKAVNRVANGLSILGIQKGDRVAIMLPNTSEFVYAFYACAKLGVVAVPFNTMYKGNEISHILRDSGARAIFCLTNSVPLINEIRPGLPALEHVITTGERTLTLADPESTFFVQAVVEQSTFSDIDDAYRRTGEALTEAFAQMGAKDAWYSHRGSVRANGKKLAGCLISEVENLYVINTLCFAAPFDAGDFFAALWVPPEIKDKAMEPVTSIMEITGRRPSFEEIRDIISQSFEKHFGAAITGGDLTREERFGYQKQKAILAKSAATGQATRMSFIKRFKKFLGFGK